MNISHSEQEPCSIPIAGLFFLLFISCNDHRPPEIKPLSFEDKLIWNEFEWTEAETGKSMIIYHLDSMENKPVELGLTYDEYMEDYVTRYLLIDYPGRRIHALIDLPEHYISNFRFDYFELDTLPLIQVKVGDSMCRLSFYPCKMKSEEKKLKISSEIIAYRMQNIDEPVWVSGRSIEDLQFGLKDDRDEFGYIDASAFKENIILLDYHRHRLAVKLK